MKLFSKPTILLGSIFVCLPLFSGSINQLGEDFEIHYTGKVEMVLDDNIFRSSTNEVDDLYFVFTPGIELRLKEEAATMAVLTYQHRFTSFSDSSELSDDFANLSFQTRYDSGVVLANASASFVEMASNTVDVQQEGVLISRDETRAEGGIRYELSDLTAFRVGVGYDKTNYDDIIYTDYSSVSVPATFFYSVRPKVDLTAGMRYRTVDTSSKLSNTFDYDDVFYYVGAVGELFSPLIFANVSVGYQERDYDGTARSDSSASYDLTVIYTGGVKSSIYGSLARDYRTSAIGGISYAYTSAALGSRYHLTDQLGLDARLEFGRSDYQQTQREQDIARFRIGASYHPNDYLTLDAHYLYTDIDGNEKDGAVEYKTNEFSVSASLRY